MNANESSNISQSRGIQANLFKAKDSNIELSMDLTSRGLELTQTYDVNNREYDKLGSLIVENSSVNIDGAQITLFTDLISVSGEDSVVKVSAAECDSIGELYGIISRLYDSNKNPNPVPEPEDRFIFDGVEIVELSDNALMEEEIELYMEKPGVFAYVIDSGVIAKEVKIAVPPVSLIDTASMSIKRPTSNGIPDYETEVPDDANYSVMNVVRSPEVSSKLDYSTVYTVDIEFYAFDDYVLRMMYLFL